MGNPNMNKLNVTEGEWVIYQDEMTNLYVVNTSEDAEGFSEGVVESIYDKNNAILMSQSKKLYEQLVNLNKLISLACEDGYCTEELFESQAQTSQLLRKCRGE